jgi:hypothetical protein
MTTRRDLRRDAKSRGELGKVAGMDDQKSEWLPASEGALGKTLPIRMALNETDVYMHNIRIHASSGFAVTTLPRLSHRMGVLESGGGTSPTARGC